MSPCVQDRLTGGNKVGGWNMALQCAARAKNEVETASFGDCYADFVSDIIE
jgi:hypothetical protein